MHTCHICFLICFISCLFVCLAVCVSVCLFLSLLATGNDVSWSALSSSVSPYEFVVQLDHPGTAVNVIINIDDGENAVVLQDVAFG